MREIKADDFARIATLYVPESVTALAIAPGGDILAIGAGDKLHIHSIQENTSQAEHEPSGVDFPRIVSLYMPDKVQAVAFTPDGKLLTVAIADKIHIYRIPI